MKDRIKKATAIKYDEKDLAPRVTAIGRGEIAEKIISAAKANDVPVFEDSSLVETLSNLQTGDHIPTELYFQ